MTAAEPLEYDPWAPEMQEDPFPAYRALRDRRPVFHHPELGFWAISRCEDVERVAGDVERFSNCPPGPLDPVAALIGQGDPLNADPPRHGELRRVLRPHFTPKAVAELEPLVRAEALALLAPLRERGGGDLAADFAWPLPVAVILRVLGLPRADTPDVTRRLRSLDAPDDEAAAVEAMRWLRDYLLDAVAQPRDDGALLATIMAARADGRLGEDEIAGICLAVVLAATGTTSSLLSNALLVLDRHPDQQALLRAGNVDLAAAVEELMRFESPVQTLPRHATTAVAMYGEMIPAGARVLLLLGSANRDERRFPEPDRLDLGRAPRRHFAFGGGIHFCIGAPLARLQARVGLTALFETAGAYAGSGPPRRIPSPDVRGLLNLPVAF